MIINGIQYHEYIYIYILYDLDFLHESFGLIGLA